MVSITIVTETINMRQTFEDRLEEMSSTTLEMMAFIKESLADEMESRGIRSKNNARVALRIRMILDDRMRRHSPAVRVKSSTTKLSGREKRS